MKKLVALIALAALAACQAQEPAVEEATAEEVPSVSVAPPAGTYETTFGDGTVNTVVIGEDGSISQTTPGGETLTGKFVAGEDGKRCVELGDQGVVCSTESPVADDGSWIVTQDDGTAFTVHPVAAAEAGQ